jgi:topoisomerase-4 subunit A
MDAASLNYKAGDAYLASARGRSNQLALFLDSFGRSYAIAAHTLPSARGQGEPLTGRLNPPSGAQFVSVIMGKMDDLYLLSTDAGYGFVCKLEDMVTRNKSGKALLSVPKGAHVLPPIPVRSLEDDRIVAVTTEGHMLVTPLAELPQLARGKGNKIINIPSAKLKAREEYVCSIDIIQGEEKLVIHAGKKHKTMKPDEVNEHLGERGRRGNKLPRGYQKVDKIEVLSKG